MKAYLMHKDRDFDTKRTLPDNEQALMHDLEINTLLDAMAIGDKFIFEIVKKAVLCGENDLENLRYRQEILKDCINNPLIVREIYQIPIEADENKHKHWMGILTHYPSGVLSSSIELMEMFVDLLRKLKKIADEQADNFVSEGFISFFTMIKKELDDDYFSVVEEHLKELKFRDGVLISAELGTGNEGTNYILRKPQQKKQGWVKGIFSNRSPVYTFYIHPRDDAGGRALSDLRDRGINLVANALAQSSDHIDSYLQMLRIELAFYIGCLNLYEKLIQMGGSITFPEAVPSDNRIHEFQGLFDISLALTKKQSVIGNDANLDNKDLVIITGANQGGKSTFLRSIGLAQLMLQCGMFVPAKNFRANICNGLFTHFKRKEDATMKSGKLDEELNRMSEIADKISSNSLVLFNESFAATNEREGSEIARQIITALLEKRIKVFFVTHMYDFAHGFYDNDDKNVCFLRAERKAGGGRTYKVVEGEPLETSFGKDVYQLIFEEEK